MNKQITALAIVAAMFVAAPKVLATETVECKSQSYGGSTCGVSTSTTTTVEYETVGAGIGDMQVSTAIMILGISAVAATALYKLTYRSYILG